MGFGARGPRYPWRGFGAPLDLRGETEIFLARGEPPEGMGEVGFEGPVFRFLDQGTGVVVDDKPTGPANKDGLLDEEAS